VQFALILVIIFATPICSFTNPKVPISSVISVDSPASVIEVNSGGLQFSLVPIDPDKTAISSDMEEEVVYQNDIAPVEAAWDYALNLGASSVDGDEELPAFGDKIGPRRIKVNDRSAGYAPALVASDPCSCAQRWTGGATWNTDGTIDDTPNAGDGKPNDPTLGGVIRCGSAAETQSNIKPAGCTYDSTVFNIDLSAATCYSPSTGLPVVLTDPTQGCEMIVINFDVRTFAYEYQYQLVTNDNIGWAMYYSQQSHTYVGTDGLSGSCQTDSLLYLACGDDFQNTFQIFEVPNFPAATNVYVFIWDQDGCNASLNLNYKARYGCGDGTANCTLVIDSSWTECTDTGTVLLKYAISGNNGSYELFDVDNNTLDRDSTILGNPGDTSLPVTDTLCIEYAYGSPYNILIDEYGGAPNSPDCEHAESGTMPGASTCCSLQVTCPDTVGGEYDCLADVPAADTTLITYTDSCYNIRVRVEHDTSAGAGCINDTLFLTRRYVVIDDDGNPLTVDDSVICERLFVSSRDMCR
jgi:hypothetical protein